MWGDELATVLIAVIVLNQLVGPPLFKWSIQLVGEAHTRARPGEELGPGQHHDREAVIFSSGGGQSIALARQLQSHGWTVRVAIRDADQDAGMVASDVDIVSLREISAGVLKELGVSREGAVVALLPDEENYALCELVYEHHGTETVVVRVQDRSWVDRFHELGALVVDPSTAMVSLLEHFVLSPGATSLLLGLEKGQEVLECEVRDPGLDGVPLRDLTLPVDVLILSVHRGDHTLLSHGYTTLQLGDHVTVVGPPDELPEVELLLGD